MGFIKVEINGEKSAFLIQIKNLGKFSGKGSIYLVFADNIGIEIGEIPVRNGEAREIYDVEANDVRGSGNALDSVLGVKIELDDAFLASCWTDDTQAVVGKPLMVWKREEPKQDIMAAADSDNVTMQPSYMQDNGTDQARGNMHGETSGSREQYTDNASNSVNQADKSQKYNATANSTTSHRANSDIRTPDGIERIDISELRMLPTKNWYLVNNSFLAHGYANYKHLVIKTDANGQKHLGVPGVSEPPERMMAKIFGFSQFEPAAPASAADVDSGVFGYWFCPLEL
ncbi:DUF6128 domain-containing protein [Agathobacter sp.]